MKRVILALLGLIVITGFCMAQFRHGNFTQRGTATQEQQIDGLVAAHPSLPIGSRVIITNVENEKKVEVTIVGRILASSDRIIDLSHETAFFLDMNAKGEVIVSFPYPLDPYEIPLSEIEPPLDFFEPDPMVIVAGEPDPEPTIPAAEPEKQPVNITIYSYIFDSENSLIKDKPEDMDYLEWLALKTLDSREVRKVVEHKQAWPETRPEVRPELLSEARPPAIKEQEKRNSIRVMPALPDPNSDLVYRLQVGAFSSVNSADAAFRKLQDAGFDAVREQKGTMYRVFAAGVPAKVVNYAVNRLEQMGFTEVWINE